LEGIRIVLDATVLVNFARVNEIDLLQNVKGNFIVPSIVFDQLKQNVNWTSEQKECFDKLLAEQTMTIRTVRGKRSTQLLSRYKDLDEGDAEALVLAESRNGRLASDDLGLRKIAQDRGVEITGSIGLLYEMIHRKVISLEQGTQILTEMIDHDFYTPFTPEQFKRNYRRTFDT